MKIKNRALRKTLSVLAIAFAVAAGTAGALEWSGYNGFDRADGENLLCKVDPYCRPLTGGEAALAREVFGKAVDTRNVKIFNRSYMFLFGRGGAISPNGNVYIDEPKAVADYSLEPYRRSVFIHEMTHVWQYQQGRNIRREAVGEWWKSGFKYKSIYAYDIDAHPRFKAYNLEQQAGMVEDYHMTRSYPSLWYNLACPDLKKLEDKISQEIPQTQPSGCPAIKPPNPSS